MCRVGRYRAVLIRKGQMTVRAEFVALQVTLFPVCVQFLYACVRVFAFLCVLFARRVRFNNDNNIERGENICLPPGKMH